jgi:hypothetical protein
MGVQIATCKVAEKTKAVTARSAVLKVLRTVYEDWLLDAAYPAAVALGARFEALAIAIERLDEKGMAANSLQQLSTVVQARPGSWGGSLDLGRARVLKRRWRAFLHGHSKELKAGRRFKIGDPALSAELFPREIFRFKRGDGTSWP